QRAGDEGGPVICALPFFAANQSNGDADERRDRSHCIHSMMPGVGLDCAAFHVSSKLNNVTKKNFLYDDRHDEDRERPWGGCMVRQKNFAHTLNRKTDCGGQNADCNDYGRNRFGLAVTVWMRLIRRSRGNG